MSPCEGCIKRMSDPKGPFRMRFVGRPGGKLMKNAPGNYKHGEIYQQPYHMSQFKFWELIEKVPTLVAPPLDDGDEVFEDAVYIPDDDVSVEVSLGESPVSEEEEDIDKYINNDTPVKIEPFTAYHITSGAGVTTFTTTPVIKKQTEYTSTTSPIEEVTLSIPEPEEELDRKELIKTLDEAGVEYKKGARTTTLKKLVDELVSKE